mgnify:CR=1 FL=1
MARNFAEIAFTPEVKKLQEKMGSRASYARIEKTTNITGLTEDEMGFISQRDSFYMSTIGESGYPYIQHRGGPRGFLKVLDKKRLGFIDFKGNMQYISTGNIATNNKTALILVDYPARARLKIYATTEIVELKDNPELYDMLDLKDYKFRPERMMVFNIEAYDWNCPQHITPRYTVEEIEQLFAPRMKHTKELETEVIELKKQIRELQAN